MFLKYQATLLTYKRNINILQGSNFPTKILHYALLVSLTRAACPTLANVIPYQWPERFSIHDEKINRVLSLECRYLALRCTFFIRGRVLSSPKRPHRFWGPPIQLIPGISFPGVKRLRREVNHSHQSCASVKNEWKHTFTTPVILHTADKENFSIYTTQSVP
jgi:hypothetical protein